MAATLLGAGGLSAGGEPRDKPLTPEAWFGVGFISSSSLTATQHQRSRSQTGCTEEGTIAAPLGRDLQRPGTGCEARLPSAEQGSGQSAAAFRY